MNSTNESKKNKFFRELDARDIGRFILTKSWIIIVAAIACIAISLVFTHFITPKYSASSSMMVVVGDSENAQSWTIGNQIIQASPEIIDGNEFCRDVASMLTSPTRTSITDTFSCWQDFIHAKSKKNNTNYIYDALYTSRGKYETIDDIGQFTGITIVKCGGDAEKAQKENYNEIYNLLKSSITVSFDSDSPNTFTVTANTENPELSYILANAVMLRYQYQIQNYFQVQNDTLIITDIYDTGSIVAATAENSTNQNFTRNAVIAAGVAVLVSVAVLVVVFIFDDKIKTPDDVEKHLGLNILGAVPEFESK